MVADLDDAARHRFDALLVTLPATREGVLLGTVDR